MKTEGNQPIDLSHQSVPQDPNYPLKAQTVPQDPNYPLRGQMPAMIPIKDLDC